MVNHAKSVCKLLELFIQWQRCTSPVNQRMCTLLCNVIVSRRANISFGENVSLRKSKWETWKWVFICRVTAWWMEAQVSLHWRRCEREKKVNVSSSCLRFFFFYMFSVKCVRGSEKGVEKGRIRATAAYYPPSAFKGKGCWLNRYET